MRSGFVVDKQIRNSRLDWIRSYLARPMNADPGKLFQYDSMDTYLLSAIVQKVTGMTVLDYLKQKGILPIGYMPLGSPRRPERDIAPEDVVDMQQPALQEIAAAHGCHPAEICLKWSLQRGILPIPFSVHHYENNLRAAVTEQLSEEEMARISALECGNRLVKGQVFLWEGAEDWHELWDEE